MEGLPPLAPATCAVRAAAELAVLLLFASVSPTVPPDSEAVSDRSLVVSS